MSEIYNYIIVIIKYDVGHWGFNPFFICGSSFGLVIEIIGAKVEERESNWVRACLLGSYGTPGVIGLCTGVVWLASPADPGDNYSQRNSGTECSVFIPPSPSAADRLTVALHVSTLCGSPPHSSFWVGAWEQQESWQGNTGKKKIGKDSAKTAWTWRAVPQAPDLVLLLILSTIPWGEARETQRDHL